MDPKRNAEIEAFIREQFEQNFEILRYETSGHALAPGTKEVALNQLLLYWRKLHDIAESVTDTEVKLTLPAQKTPHGHTFGIEGVVDIVREEGMTVMYDIKTHDVDYVRSNKELYEQQLNIYAYIWQTLRNQELDHTAIIATKYPEAVEEALASGDPARLAHELGRWEPLVKLDFAPERVQQTIDAFAATVDDIEDGIFTPPPQEKLQATVGGTNTRFATRICRNCDARFSCDAYRTYALAGMGGQVEARFRRYYEDYGNDTLQESWRTANLTEQAARNPNFTDDDLV